MGESAGNVLFLNRYSSYTFVLTHYTVHTLSVQFSILQWKCWEKERLEEVGLANRDNTFIFIANRSKKMGQRVEQSGRNDNKFILVYVKDPLTRKNWRRREAQELEQFSRRWDGRQSGALERRPESSALSDEPTTERWRRSWRQRQAGKHVTASLWTSLLCVSIFSRT